MSSGISEIKNAANWWFGAQVLPTNAKDLFEIIVEQLQAVFSGKFSEDDLKSMQQYALGRYQRSAQTVGGTAAGYSSRYFFDEEIEDYYAVPQRIDAVSLKNISDATKAMFNDRIWGFGVLGNAGKEQVAELQNQISRLWK
jgi:predicted Zn-dependent peptidase